MSSFPHPTKTLLKKKFKEEKKLTYTRDDDNVKGNINAITEKRKQIDERTVTE